MLDAALLVFNPRISRNNKRRTTANKFMDRIQVWSPAEAKARLTGKLSSNLCAARAQKISRAGRSERVGDCRTAKKSRASYQTIRAMLKDNAGIEVSHQTIARYCREVLDAARRGEGRVNQATTPREPTASPPKGNWQRRVRRWPVTVTRTAKRPDSKAR